MLRALEANPRVGMRQNFRRPRVHRLEANIVHGSVPPRDLLFVECGILIPSIKHRRLKRRTAGHCSERLARCWLMPSDKLNLSLQRRRSLAHGISLQHHATAAAQRFRAWASRRCGGVREKGWNRELARKLSAIMPSHTFSNCVRSWNVRPHIGTGVFDCVRLP